VLSLPAAAEDSSQSAQAGHLFLATNDILHPTSWSRQHAMLGRFKQS
jgi:hypothetical protein